MIGMVSAVANYSNRDIEKLFDQYNPNKIKSGDMVKVTLSHASYAARVIGLGLDIKNKKVYADLKLVEQNRKHPTRVDVADCRASSGPLYPGHHNNERVK
tara:strand:- start:386 stop:685 length:300 start_codon:yes stop_codon:yes gene_type:complete